MVVRLWLCLKYSTKTGISRFCRFTCCIKAYLRRLFFLGRCFISNRRCAVLFLFLFGLCEFFIVFQYNFSRLVRPPRKCLPAAAIPALRLIPVRNGREPHYERAADFFERPVVILEKSSFFTIKTHQQFFGCLHVQRRESVMFR